MKHYLFKQLILCIFYGIIPWTLISWYISKNQKELGKASKDLHVATENFKNVVIDEFQKPKNKIFLFIMAIALVIILVYPFK